MINQKKKLVEVKHLKQYFNQGKKNEVRAIEDISFDIYKGETLGLVGESGCGKSTTGKAIIKLNDITSGEIIYDGTDIHNIRKRQDMLKFNKKIQMIFQDPYASLNPRLKVMDIVGEGIDIHHLATDKRNRKKRVYDALETVGLSKEHANRYPHEFSGGQRQRIGIARALAVEPEFIIADEPISALDVSIQAQVVNIMLRLQREKGITFLFIAHDLSMVKYISDRIAVMHFGKIVELGPADDIYIIILYMTIRSNYYQRFLNLIQTLKDKENGLHMKQAMQMIKIDNCTRFDQNTLSLQLKRKQKN